MKRDWKLIRAILREEQTASWPDDVVNNHRVLCAEAGFANFSWWQSLRGLEVLQTREPLLTVAGYEAAAKLENADDLDAVLTELREKGVGEVSDLVLGLMEMKAKERIKLQAT